MLLKDFCLSIPKSTVKTLDINSLKGVKGQGGRNESASVWAGSDEIDEEWKGLTDENI